MQRVHGFVFRLAGLLLLAGMFGSSGARAQVSLQQVVSRENAEFSLTTPYWNIGADGNVYLCNWDQAANNSCIMRIGANGTPKYTTVLYTEAGCSVAANANGIIAVAHQHFAACVKLYDPELNLLATVTGFNSSNFDAPADVEVGEQSGDFYALDQWNNRILRISGQSGSYGQIVATYAYAAQAATIYTFRVSEKNNLFYLYNGTNSSAILVAIDMTSLTQQWSLSSNQIGNPFGIAVDTTGTLYTLAPGSTTINEWNNSGNASGSVTLAGALTDNTTLRVYNGQAYVRYYDPTIYNGMLNTQLFQVYTLSTGAWVRTVVPAEDVLSVSYGSETWTAGAVIPFTLTFTSTQTPTPTPVWHVWARPLDSAVTIGSNDQIATAYQDFGYSTANGGQITVPSGCAGLYQIKVTPETAGWQRGTVSAYWVDDIVEIRTPGAPGAISVFTTAATPIAGTVALTNGSANVVGTGTSFTTALAVGDTILVDGQYNTMPSITDTTHLTVTNNFTDERERTPFSTCAQSAVTQRPAALQCGRPDSLQRQRTLPGGESALLSDGQSGRCQ